MIVELDRDSRMSLRRLFDSFPYMRACIAAAIEDGAGKVFADSRENPSVALAVVDFQFLAGDPFHESVPLLFNFLHAKEWLIAPTPDWQHVVSTTYPGKIEVYQREAFQAEQFDVDKLGSVVSELPAGFELRRVQLEDVKLFTELSPSLISSYASPEDFIDHGVGMGIFHEGRFVSGASSSPIGGGKLEFEIQTHRQFRRRGLARIVAAALILYCLENGLEPCWDAANEPSSALARQLGFCSTGKYNAFWLPQPEDKIATN
jgi:GNAT superfamily N-acetyltransferase